MNREFMLEAIRLAKEGMDKGSGGPFGAVVVKDGKIVGRGWNKVTSTNDPTAHAEVSAIRDACANLKMFQLDGCDIYTSCEPCPMCLGAIYWARPEKVYFACTHEDAAIAGFDDSFIYKEIETPLEKRKIPGLQLMREEGLILFQEWIKKTDRTLY
ncbi:MAG: nucleoside deaminase [Bacteroidota bacterium]